ncbi:aminoglycoside phosphotransferase family protein [Plantactinospora soyae]|uniref:Aminoglycoside phosphotransferase n=1 Tax=Plantactinospora soyae TaxID=1544732 RepID=A0A927M7P9_9ACTN|nr:aminoglycoside phosphotransferase family protein [Plantactinospora soyae]MBE1489517.1 hypothetical protein [Plantactinospora soyae]
MTGAPGLSSLLSNGSHRTAWADLPDEVRHWAEGLLGGPVVEAVTTAGGFSPGAVCRLRTSGGRRAFVKAVSSRVNERSAELHRRELRVAAGLHTDPAVPTLWGGYDDGVWVALMSDDVGGTTPRLPWRNDDVLRVLTALAEFQRRNTPARVDGLEQAAVANATALRAWQRLAEAPPADLDDWSRRNLERLAAVEATWPSLTHGDGLLHGDLRADNIVLAGAEVMLVDWPWASLGPGWLDVVNFAPTVTTMGGPEPEWVLAHSPSMRDAPSEGVTAAAVAAAGFYTEQEHLPPPPGLWDPRPWQRAQARTCRDWIRHRTGWR